MNSNHNGSSEGQGGEHLFDIQQESLLEQYLSIILRNKWTVLAIFGVIFGATAVYTFSVDPIYEASSLVLINMREGDLANPIVDVTGSATANKITNELESMKSNANAAAVAQTLLSRKYLDEGKTVIIPVIKTDAETARWDSLATEKVVVSRLRRAVDFTPVRESDIIKITAQSTDPREAALIANIYTTIYSTRNMAMNRMRSQALREFLETQLKTKRSILDTTETELQRYMNRSGIVSLDVETNRSVEHLAQLEAQRDGLEVEKNARLKTLASYKDELTRQEPNAAKAIGESNDSYIKLLQEQLGKLEVQRDVTVAQNPGAVQQKLYSDKLQEINLQIEEIKKRLEARTKLYLASLQPTGTDPYNANSSFLAQLKAKIIDAQIELTGIGARISALNSVIGESELKFNQIPRKSIDLARLQRERLSSEKLYLLVEEKYNEAAIKEQSEFGNVNIMDNASVPLRPVSPRIGANLILGCIVGLGIGVWFVLLRSMLDRFVRTPEDVKRCGFVPLTTIMMMNGELKKIEADIAATKMKRFIDPHLITYYRPLSPLSESYRHLRAKVKYVHADKPLQCIVVTSCNPKEGKTTTTANLAISFAQTEKKVLLVEADLRRASVHVMFGLRNVAGLNEYLLGKASFDDVVQKDVVPQLDVLTCGVIPTNPAEILGSARMKTFIQQMRQKYDYIIFDAPPLLAVTDAAVLATEADGVLLVASAGETHAAGLQRIAEFLTSIGVSLLGVVLNKFEAQKAYGSTYTSYASYHYGYYGYDLATHKKPSVRKLIN